MDLYSIALQFPIQPYASPPFSDERGERELPRFMIRTRPPARLMCYRSWHLGRLHSSTTTITPRILMSANPARTRKSRPGDCVSRAISRREAANNQQSLLIVRYLRVTLSPGWTPCNDSAAARHHSLLITLPLLSAWFRFDGRGW